MVKANRSYQRYSRGIRLAYTACWVVILAVGAAMIVAPADHDPLAVRGIGALIAVVAAVLVQRSLRWGSVDVRADRVVIHELLGTSKIATGAIDRFLVVRNAFSSNPRGRDLAVRTTTGETIVFGDFSTGGVEDHFSIEGLAAS